MVERRGALDNFRIPFRFSGVIFISIWREREQRRSLGDPLQKRKVFSFEPERTEYIVGKCGQKLAKNVVFCVVWVFLSPSARGRKKQGNPPTAASKQPPNSVSGLSQIPERVQEAQKLSDPTEIRNF